MREKLQFDIPLVLPEVADTADACVGRVLESLRVVRGVQEAHVEGGRLCLHVDTDLVPLVTIERLVRDAGAEVGERYRHEQLSVRGMDCADCAFSIEHVLSRTDGVVSASADYAGEALRIEYDTAETDHETVVRRVEAMGYTVEARPRPETWVRRHSEVLRSGAAGVLVGAAYLLEGSDAFPRPVTLALYAVAYAAGGFEVARHGLTALARGSFSIDLLMTLAALGAAALGEWVEGGILLFLFGLGHALEDMAMDRARGAVAALGTLTPRTARVRRDGTEDDVAVESLRRGDVVVVRPGERVCADGAVVSGASAVDQSPITGESMPVETSPGAEVFAGTVNGEGTLEVRVTRLSSESMISRVVELVAAAQTQKPRTQQFVERFSRVYVPVVIAGVVAVCVVPPVAGWLGWKAAFLRGMSVLVSASPCALAIATPAATLSAIARAARRGVLVKGGVHLENLGRLDAVAFDKTGTLTEGRPRVVDVVPGPGVKEAEVLRVAAAVEARSTHPLARAVVAHAGATGTAVVAAEEVVAVTGRGVTARLGGERVWLGSASLFEEQGLVVPAGVARRMAALEEDGRTTMLVQVGGRFVGGLAVADEVRGATPGALRALRHQGVRRLVMLTGDNERVAAAVARRCGVEEYRAGLLPEDKVAVLRSLLDEGLRVGMVGDGTNDAPALAAATVGIAMGASGTDVALETADVALMSDDVSAVPFAVSVGRRTRAVVRVNLAIALGVVAVLVPLAILGTVGISLSIVFHEGSTLLVVGNGLTLLRRPRGAGTLRRPAPAGAACPSGR